MSSVCLFAVLSVCIAVTLPISLSIYLFKPVGIGGGGGYIKPSDESIVAFAVNDPEKQFLSREFLHKLTTET